MRFINNIVVNYYIIFYLFLYPHLILRPYLKQSKILFLDLFSKIWFSNNLKIAKYEKKWNNEPKVRYLLT